VASPSHQHNGDTEWVSLLYSMSFWDYMTAHLVQCTVQIGTSFLVYEVRAPRLVRNLDPLRESTTFELFPAIPTSRPSTLKTELMHCIITSQKPVYNAMRRGKAY